MGVAVRARTPSAIESTAEHLKLVGEVSPALFTPLTVLCYQFKQDMGNN